MTLSKRQLDLWRTAMKYNLTRDQLIEKKFELTGRYRIAFNGVTFSLYHVYKNKKELHPKFVQ